MPVVGVDIRGMGGDGSGANPMLANTGCGEIPVTNPSQLRQTQEDWRLKTICQRNLSRFEYTLSI
jgi:hypothetical protein